MIILLAKYLQKCEWSCSLEVLKHYKSFSCLNLFCIKMFRINILALHLINTKKLFLLRATHINPSSHHDRLKLSKHCLEKKRLDDLRVYTWDWGAEKLAPLQSQLYLSLCYLLALVRPFAESVYLIKFSNRTMHFLFPPGLLG